MIIKNTFIKLVESNVEEFLSMAAQNNINATVLYKNNELLLLKIEDVFIEVDLLFNEWYAFDNIAKEIINVDLYETIKFHEESVKTYEKLSVDMNDNICVISIDSPDHEYYYYCPNCSNSHFIKLDGPSGNNIFKCADCGFTVRPNLKYTYFSDKYYKDHYVGKDLYTTETKIMITKEEREKLLRKYEKLRLTLNGMFKRKKKDRDMNKFEWMVYQLNLLANSLQLPNDFGSYDCIEEGCNGILFTIDSTKGKIVYMCRECGKLFILNSDGKIVNHICVEDTEQ